MRVVCIKILIINVCIQGALLAQNVNIIDAKKIIYDNSVTDSVYIYNALKIAENYVQILPDTGIKYAQLGLERAKSTCCEIDQMKLSKQLAIGYATKSEYNTAKHILLDAIGLYNAKNYKQPFADLFHTLGLLYLKQNKKSNNTD